jgi:hypothetical protein
MNLPETSREIQDRSTLLSLLPPVCDPWKDAIDIPLSRNEGRVTVSFSSISKFLTLQDQQKIQIAMMSGKKGHVIVSLAGQPKALLVDQNGSSAPLSKTEFMLELPVDSTQDYPLILLDGHYHKKNSPAETLRVCSSPNLNDLLNQKKVVRFNLDEHGAIPEENLFALGLQFNRSESNKYGEYTLDHPIALIDHQGQVLDFGSLTLRYASPATLRVATKPTLGGKTPPFYAHSTVLFLQHPSVLQDLITKASVVTNSKTVVPTTIQETRTATREAHTHLLS